jgi:hypothetical protein
MNMEAQIDAANLDLDAFSQGGRTMEARQPSPIACTRCLSREQTRLKVAPKARLRRQNSRPWPMRSRPTKPFAGPTRSFPAGKG